MRQEIRQRIHAHTTPMFVEGLLGVQGQKNYKLTSPDGKVHLGIAGELFPFLAGGDVVNVSFTIMKVSVEKTPRPNGADPHRSGP